MVSANDDELALGAEGVGKATLVDRGSRRVAEEDADALPLVDAADCLGEERRDGDDRHLRTELDPVIERILADNPKEVDAYRGGKQALLGFFVGQVMKETQGKANPKVVNDRLREKLNA